MTLKFYKRLRKMTVAELKNCFSWKKFGLIQKVLWVEVHHYSSMVTLICIKIILNKSEPLNLKLHLLASISVS